MTPASKAGSSPVGPAPSERAWINRHGEPRDDATGVGRDLGEGSTRPTARSDDIAALESYHESQQEPVAEMTFFNRGAGMASSL